MFLVWVPSFLDHTSPSHALCNKRKKINQRNFILKRQKIFNLSPGLAEITKIHLPFLKSREKTLIQNILLWFPGAVSAPIIACLIIRKSQRPKPIQSAYLKTFITIQCIFLITSGDFLNVQA